MNKQKWQLMHLETRLIVCIALVLVFISGVTSNVIPQNEQESLSDNQGLYNASDLVIVLNDTNFKANVYNSKKAWLVEFYNSWCGFCQRFAPIWKALAKSIHGWKDIVTIAAIDCANDDNNPLCREYEIMRYPTLKFFPIDSKKDFLGLEFQKDKDEILITQALIDQLVKEQQEQRAGPSWPNIVPYRGNELDALWQGAPSNVQYEFLIFEEPKSYLGAAVILDLHKFEDIRIRRVTSENEFLSVTSKVNKYPSLIALDRNKSQTFVKINSDTREGIREAIAEFLKSKGISIDIKEDPQEINEHFSKDNSKHKIETQIMNNKLADKLYQLDLETALRYSLNNEIPLSPVLDGEKLKALKTYLTVLNNYFPVYLPKMKTYLQVLKEITTSKSNMTNKEFKEHVKVKQKGLEPIYSAPKRWIGCEGSSPQYRGYPCGLWTLFHTLTVAAADDIDNELNDDDHPSVLAAMHGYIKNFFSCADCSQHFQKMSDRRKIFEVPKGDENILWLWRAHNEVNERLAGDVTEDPEYKKIQYPKPEHCPKCRLSDGKWDEVEVLYYLKTKYSRSNIDYQGISGKIIQREVNSSASNSGASHHKLGWDFTIFDISICVVLYVASAAILTLVCIKFAYKRTYKKKIAIQNLFGLA